MGSSEGRPGAPLARDARVGKSLVLRLPRDVNSVRRPEGRVASGGREAPCRRRAQKIGREGRENL